MAFGSKSLKSCNLGGSALGSLLRAKIPTGIRLRASKKNLEGVPPCLIRTFWPIDDVHVTCISGHR